MAGAAPLAATEYAVCNVTCLCSFSCAKGEGVIPEVHATAGCFVQHPWSAFMVHTVLGNACYQLDSPRVQMMGLRSLEHALGVGALLHTGRVRGLQVQNYGVDSNLGCYIQVSHGCFMERAIEVLFPSEVAVVPRTEELSNVVLLHIADAAAFLLAAHKLGMIDDFERHTLPCTKVSVQVTKVGHVKLRLSWGDTFSVELPEEVAEADVTLKSIGAAVEQFCQLMVTVLRCLC